MKMCKNCKWYKRTWLFGGSDTFAVCKCPNIKTKTIIDNVSGKKHTPVIYCREMRIYEKYCGEEARWFE